ASLLEEWERMLEPEGETPEQKPAASRIHELARDPRILRSRIRSELHMLVKALAAKDYEEAAGCVRADVAEPWTEDRFEAALAPFFEQHERMLADARARQSQWTIIDAQGTQEFRVRQVLLDPQDENTWYLEGRVDLSDRDEAEGPLLELLHIGG